MGQMRSGLQSNSSDVSLNTPVPLVSVIVLNRNGGEYSERCVLSLLRNDYDKFEILVVDNASVDDSLERVLRHRSERLRVIRNSQNVGFSEGSNIGARATKGSYLFILNQDTEVSRSCIRKLVQTAVSNTEAGAVSCKVLSLDEPGVFDTGGHDIDILGFTYDRSYRTPDTGQHDRVEPIFGVNGAAFLVDRALYNELGGLDPRFFAIYEETDLCWKIWLRGRSVLFAPEAVVYHKGGISKRPLQVLHLRLRNQMRSLIKNYEAWRIPVYVPAYMAAVIALLLVALRRRNLGCVSAIISAVLWNLGLLGESVLARRLVEPRMASNDLLLKRGLIKPFNVARLRRHVTKVL